MARRIAVAATAPFGADVLERLAAEHDVNPPTFLEAAALAAALWAQMFTPEES
jgi:hypothetical protein